MIKQSVKSTDQDSETFDNRHAPWSAPSQTLTRERAGKDHPWLIDNLGWTREEAIDTHSRLRPFEEEWSAPEMDVYDDL